MLKQIVITSLSKEDQEQIQKIYKTDPFYRYIKNQAPVQFDPAPFNIYWVAKDPKSKAFIGYIKGYLPQENDAIWIQTLLIAKPFLRNHYGASLVYHFLLPYMRGNHRNIYLTCHKDNQSGIAFWESLDMERQAKVIHHDYILYKGNTRRTQWTQKYLKHWNSTKF